MAINTQERQGQWNKLRGQVKEKWGQLTDDDLQIHRRQRRPAHRQDPAVVLGEGREAVEKFPQRVDLQGLVGDLAGGRAPRRHASPIRLATASADQYGNLTEQAREKYEYGQDVSVRHNPAQSVAAAFGVGLVAGLIVASSCPPFQVDQIGVTSGRGEV